MSRRRRARLKALLIWLLSIGVVVVLLAAAGLWAVNFFKPAPPPLSVGCTAAVGDGTYSLAPDQADNAALITAIAVRRGLPARAGSIALAVALQESKLRNITSGDLDSLGLFQQRPSQGWGSQEQIMDPVYATNAFYDGLIKVGDYESLPITEAAQQVQRSAYPQAYAQREAQGKAFASALAGLSPAALSCTLDTPTAAGNPGAVVSKLEMGYGPVRTTTAGSSVGIEASGTAGWSYAQWAVANAAALNITAVSFDGEQWVRSDNADGRNRGWQPSTAPAETVTITLPTPQP
ncbi:MAG TPA: hypothetical protein VLI70_05815 [Micrococcaceae bacterium]|nr:hypothetical protein [Micrococcaceae bacterium]